MLVSTPIAASMEELDDAVRAMLAAVESEDEVISKQEEVVSVQDEEVSMLPGKFQELLSLFATGALLSLRMAVWRRAKCSS
jgi:hypothetical protein